MGFRVAGFFATGFVGLLDFGAASFASRLASISAIFALVSAS